MNVFFFLCFLSPVLGLIEMGIDGQIVNVETLGRKLQLKFILESDIILTLPKENGTRLQNGKFQYIELEFGTELITAEVNDGKGEISFGLYGNFHSNPILIGNELHPHLLEKMIIGKGLFLAFQNWTHVNVQLPQTNEIINIKAEFLAHSPYIYFPAFLKPDMTKPTCYRITDLDLNFCTDDKTLKKDKFVIQSWDKNYLGIGLHLANKQLLGISLERGKGFTVWRAWDETIIYDTEINISIAVVAIFSLLWYLLQSSADQNRKTDSYSFFSISTGFVSTVIMSVIIVRQFYVYDLGRRVQYVTNVNIFIYGIIVMATLPFLVCLYIYSTRHAAISFEVRKFSYDTLLAFALGSIFVGRTDICEETIVGLMVGCLWTPFQVMAIFRSKGKARWWVFLLFCLIYPLVVIVLVEPIMEEVVELHTHAWVSTQIILLLPPFMTGVLASSSPMWLLTA